MNKNTLIAGITILILVSTVVVVALTLNNAGTPASSDGSSTQNTGFTQSSTQQDESITVSGEYLVNAPNTLILVDATGRRTGKDPVTGIVYKEIPNTSYVEEATSPGHRNGELFLSGLPLGSYELRVLGASAGQYVLDVSAGAGRQVFQGSIQKGDVITYVVKYGAALPPSFTLQSSTSSGTQ